MSEWHHSPTHRLKANGAYIITGATLHKKPFFKRGESLDLLQTTLFQLAKRYRIALRAWAIFPNHYHLVLLTYPESADLGIFVRHLHSQSARELNKMDQTPGRRVWFNFWDSQLTWEGSYYARLNYVMNNPVRHRIVDDAKHYQWCSARWFAENVDGGHYKTVVSYGYERLEIEDEY